MTETQTTRLGRKWLLKMSIFAAAGVIVAIWSLVDAMILFPARGARAAERFQFLYLDTLTERGTRPAPVAFDPRDEIRRLAGEAVLKAISPEDKHKLDWLEQLRLIGRLGTERVSIPDAPARYHELAAKWLKADGTRLNAVALQAYDIPLQWLFFACGAGMALWIGQHVLRVSRRRYTWHPGEQRLTLPDGSTLVPADIAEFDKRKWDKFLIYLTIKPGHPSLPGREIVLDLYHHAPLEDWILEMERTAFPENSAPLGTPPDAPPGAPHPAPAAEAPA